MAVSYPKSQYHDKHTVMANGKKLLGISFGGKLSITSNQKFTKKNTQSGWHACA